MSTIKSESGEISSYVSINKDITRRVLLEQELKKANEKLEETIQEKTKNLSNSLFYSFILKNYFL